ncbi:hypothetical protein [Xenorhabdus doucetiae]|uniref:hypothetical protein n=1 Tax=Xenorhabdus doucetiae TaxID=351671 RepID=UPI00142F2DFF|nr:hypothetical protein [Xenorhabdus doucetiae]
MPRIKMDGRFYDPQQIARFIPAWTLITSLYSVRLIACYSADPDSNNKYTQHWGEELDRSSSFGSQLSRHLKNVYVRAYAGNLVTSRPDDEAMWNYFMVGGEKAFAYVSNQCFRIFKNEPDYHCVVFFNGEIVKERYSIQAVSELGLVRV